MYLWLRPNEVIEAADGNPLPVQPEAPHGAFVYLFHEDVLVTGEVDVALDRYFAVSVESNVDGIVDDTGLFRALALVDGDRDVGAIGGPPMDCETFCRDHIVDGRGVGFGGGRRGNRKTGPAPPVVFLRGCPNARNLVWASRRETADIPSWQDLDDWARVGHSLSPDLLSVAGCPVIHAFKYGLHLAQARFLA